MIAVAAAAVLLASCTAGITAKSARCQRFDEAAAAGQPLDELAPDPAPPLPENVREATARVIEPRTGPLPSGDSTIGQPHSDLPKLVVLARADGSLAEVREDMESAIADRGWSSDRVREAKMGGRLSSWGLTYEVPPDIAGGVSGMPCGDGIGLVLYHLPASGEHNRYRPIDNLCEEVDFSVCHPLLGDTSAEGPQDSKEDDDDGDPVVRECTQWLRPAGTARAGSPVHFVASYYERRAGSARSFNFDRSGHTRIPSHGSVDDVPGIGTHAYLYESHLVVSPAVRYSLRVLDGNLLLYASVELRPSGSDEPSEQDRRRLRETLIAQTEELLSALPSS